MNLKDVLPTNNINEEEVKKDKKVECFTSQGLEEQIQQRVDEDGLITVKDSQGNDVRIHPDDIRMEGKMETEKIANIDSYLQKLDKVAEEAEVEYNKKKEEEEKHEYLLNGRTQEIEEEEEDEQEEKHIKVADENNFSSINDVSDEIINLRNKNTVENNIELKEDINDDVEQEEELVDKNEDDIREIDNEDPESKKVPDPEIILDYEEYLSKNKKKKDVDVNNIKVRAKKKNKKKLEGDGYHHRIINDIKNRTAIRQELPISGYVAFMTGLSSVEIRNVMNTLSQMENDKASFFEILEYKYKLVYDLMFKSTLGKITFDEFLKNTAVAEFDLLIFAVYRASNQDFIVFPRNCQNDKCGKHYDYKQYIKNMYYVSDADLPEYKKMIKELNDNNGYLAKPKHILSKNRSLLEDSGIIVEFKQPTLYNNLYDISRNVTKEQEDNVMMNAMPYINKIFVPVDDEEGEYDLIDSFDEIFEILSVSLSENDDNKLAELVMEKINVNKVKFVTKEPICPYCNQNKAESNRLSFIDIEEMFFLTHRIKLLYNQK